MEIEKIIKDLDSLNKLTENIINDIEKDINKNELLNDLKKPLLSDENNHNNHDGDSDGDDGDDEGDDKEEDDDRITKLKIKKIKKNNGKRRPFRRLRVPNTDHIKIIPGEKILIPLNDGDPLFGREEETPEEVKANWTIVYRANHFKLRIYCLLFLHWITCVTLFSSVFGVPLLLGRFVINIINYKYYNINNYINPPSTKSIRPDLPVHDGQSFAIGSLVLLLIAFTIKCINRFIDGNMKRTAKLCFLYIKLYFKEKVKKDKLKNSNENNEKESLLHSALNNLPLDMDNEEAINLIKNEQVLPEPSIFISVVGKWWSKLIKNAFDIILKISYISLVISFIVPMLFGLILEFYLISIIRIPLNQSNVLIISDIWSYGLVLLSIMVSIINIGPQTRFKTIFQEIKNDGFFNFKLKTLHQEVVFPTIKISLLLIIAPLIFAYIVLWIYSTFIAPDSYDFIKGFEIVRYSFVCTLTVAILIEVWYYFVNVCNKWMDSVKDEEYLIGRKLHNIEEDVSQQTA
jgi:E3 ubiquitin-protein ligase DOA10